MSSKDKKYNRYINIITLNKIIDTFLTQRNVSIVLIDMAKHFTVPTIYFVNIDLKLEFPINVRNYFDSSKVRNERIFVTFINREILRDQRTRVFVSQFLTTTRDFSLIQIIILLYCCLFLFIFIFGNWSFKRNKIPVSSFQQTTICNC